MTKTTRRSLILTGGAALFAPTVLRAQDFEPDAQIPASGGGVRRNASSFRSQDWRDHFPTLGVATIVADTKSRALHFWDSTGTDYRPTANMRRRDPSLPAFMEAGPDNPLGTHAMYLDWPAYLIHGTHDTRKIGRRSSSGCIGLYNEQIAELFSITPVGTQVRLV